jgi:predicted small secreted protein
MIKLISQRIFLEFTINSSQYLYLVNSEAFYHGLFRPGLTSHYHQCINRGDVVREDFHNIVCLNYSSSYSFILTFIQYESNIISVGKQVFTHAMNVAQTFSHMKNELEKARNLRQELNKSEKAGITCLKRAHWIGLELYVIYL